MVEIKEEENKKHGHDLPGFYPDLMIEYKSDKDKYSQLLTSNLSSSISDIIMKYLIFLPNLYDMIDVYIKPSNDWLSAKVLGVHKTNITVHLSGHINPINGTVEYLYTSLYNTYTNGTYISDEYVKKYASFYDVCKGDTIMQGLPKNSSLKDWNDRIIGYVIETYSYYLTIRLIKHPTEISYNDNDEVMDISAEDFNFVKTPTTSWNCTINECSYTNKNTLYCYKCGNINQYTIVNNI